jgi:thiol-disulfide isomerase/thioredoxin
MTNQPPARGLSKVADIALILTCLVVGGVVVMRQFARSPSEATSADTYQPGETVALPAVDFSTAEQTAVIVVKRECAFCTKSMPLYRKLGQASAKAPGALGFVIVSLNSVEETRAHLKSEGVVATHVLSVQSGHLRIRATPTLVIVNRDGRVVKTYVGMLSGSQEEEVRRQLKMGM